MENILHTVREVLQFDPGIFDTLRFFIVEHHSLLFEEALDDLLKDSTKVDASDIADATLKASQYLQRIIESKDLRELQLIRKLLERYPDTLASELDSLSQFFQKGEGSDWKDIVDRFQKGVELVVYVPLVQILICCWEKNKEFFINEKDQTRFAKLKEICDRVDYSTNLQPNENPDSERLVTYEEAPGLHKSLKGLLCGLKDFQLVYFRVSFSHLC